MKAVRWGILIVSLFNIFIGFVLFIVGQELKNVAGYFPTIYNTYRSIAYGNACILLSLYSFLCGFLMFGVLFLDEAILKVKQK